VHVVFDAPHHGAGRHADSTSHPSAAGLDRTQRCHRACEVLTVVALIQTCLVVRAKHIKYTHCYAKVGPYTGNRTHPPHVAGCGTGCRASAPSVGMLGAGEVVRACLWDDVVVRCALVPRYSDYKAHETQKHQSACSRGGSCHMALCPSSWVCLALVRCSARGSTHSPVDQDSPCDTSADVSRITHTFPAQAHS
jgi:hypothetical protein